MVVERSRSARFSLSYELEKNVSPVEPRKFGHSLSLDQALFIFGQKARTLSDQSRDDSAGHFSCQCSPSRSLICGDLSERVMLTLIALAQMLKMDPTGTEIAKAVVLHTTLLTQMPLADRRTKSAKLDNPEKSRTNQYLSEFANVSRDVLENEIWIEAMKKGQVPCDIHDLVDGRLLKSVLADINEGSVSDYSISTFEKLANILCAISGHHVKAPKSKSVIQKSTNGVNELKMGNSKILRFSNPVFDKHLAPINISVDAKASDRQSGKIFQEVSHWHNAKRRLDPKRTSHTTGLEKEKFRALRRNQFFMAEMQAYAASLTNAAGKALEPEIITVSDTKGINRKEIVVTKGKGTQNKKGASKKAMLENIAAEKASKDDGTAKKDIDAWQTVRGQYGSDRNLRAKYLKIQAYLRDSPDAKRKTLQAEVEFHLLCILVEMYRALRNGNEVGAESSLKEELSGVVALLWDTSRRLAGFDGLTKSIAHQVRDVIKAFNLPDPGIPTPSVDRALAYDPKLSLSLPKGDELAMDLNNEDFQLLHCGPYMDRNLDSAPDPRVPFHPDAWQRRVLDELDAEHSVFVVAPTSAGKTFISFYAMEKILRGNNDDVLVYVAPTKALVNQIAAEIQARFKKSYNYAGKSVWAIHTRDYRINNPSGCQILVTVPHILQIMLLAPSNAKSWSPRVKYIIFDEIHSIGQAEDGVVWEQLLLLAPSPIIALSATVGNPEMFYSWLASTQKSSGHQVTMVTHKHRYSDLRKFVHSPPQTFSFRGLTDRPSFATLGLDGVESLTFIHPVASLVNKSRGMPDDFSLEARDCLLLWKAMKRHETKDFPVDSSLHPSQNHAMPEIIRKADVISWEQALKSLLKGWMADHDSPFDKVLEEFQTAMESARSPSQQTSKGSLAGVKADEMETIDPDNLYQTTLPLLCKLHERDALPAIFFNYDRHRCEGMCKAILDRLATAETKWKETSPSWKAKLSGWERWKRDQSKMGPKKTVKTSSKKKGKGEDDEDPSSKADKMLDATSNEPSPYASFDPEAPVDGYHFAAGHKVETSELKGYFDQMKRRGIAPWLMEALTRGIGIHHAGMNRKYRQVVEMLFRKGYLRVVIATGTLALGINMPCATVVFSGDSIFLTALNYRQAAGRAGRRGFDLLGNVVFQNISHGKICRLLSSRLPDLNGHFPVTTTLVLRLFTLLHESGNSPYAVRAINSLLSQPRLYLDGPAFKDQVLHHLRFSIEYLRKQDLLSAQGAPINFAGLTSHLYFTENSSFALNALIKEGFFHELCSDIHHKESAVLRELMVVLAHLFGRRPCREASQFYHCKVMLTLCTG